MLLKTKKNDNVYNVLQTIKKIIFFIQMMKNQKKIRDDEKNDKKGIVPFSRAPNNNRDVDEEKNRLEKVEDEDKNRNFTLGTRSDSLRIDLEDKDEKEANEQQISVNSEFDDESENNKK